MSDLTAELLQDVTEQLASIRWQVRHSEVGTVVSAGDGVAYLRGAPSVKYGELLERGDGLTALAFDLRPEEIGVIFLDAAEHIGAGDEFRPTGRVASVCVGNEVLGRVIDSLGRPMDQGSAIRATEFWPIERDAPGVTSRQPVTEPLHSGIKVIDALLPLGRGQRKLILGDRSTGKTSIALDAILAQRDIGVICIYAAIGQRKASVAEVLELLTRHNAMPYTVVVVADADSPPGHQYLRPIPPVPSASISCTKARMCW